LAGPSAKSSPAESGGVRPESVGEDKDLASAPSRQPVPEYLKEFDSIFSKESFDALPE